MQSALMTLIQEFNTKQALLRETLHEVTPYEFYSDIFNDAGERSGHPEDAQANPIFARTENKGGKTYLRNEIAFKDKLKDVVEQVQGNAFSVCSLCTYSGRNRTAANAYTCYGFAIDLDGVGPYELQTYFLGVEIDKLPVPTYIVNSGRGMHLYFIFRHPVPLYPQVADHLNRLKHGLTWRVWSNETSRIKSTPSIDRRQYQGIYQGYRCPGSLTKLGTGRGKNKYRVTAYKWGDTYDFYDLNKWVLPEYKIPESPDYASWEWGDEHTTIDDAKMKWPEWYQKRIIEGKPAGRYVVNTKLYEWWLNILKEGKSIREGNRYYCIGVLFIMAIKCNLPREVPWSDALDLLAWFDEFTVHEENHFTIEDIKAAAKYYKPSYARYSISAIEAKTGIKIKRRTKPKYTRQEAITIARTVQGLRDKNGSWRNKEGRPDLASIVKEWQAAHPDGRKADCIRDTGLSKPTVYKWWQEI